MVNLPLNRKPQKYVAATVHKCTEVQKYTQAATHTV